jgi:hypothetical protein
LLYSLLESSIPFSILIVACAVQPLEVFVFVDVVTARGESLLSKGKDDKILILPSAFGVNSVFSVIPCKLSIERLAPYDLKSSSIV